MLDRKYNHGAWIIPFNVLQPEHRAKQSIDLLLKMLQCMQVPFELILINGRAQYVIFTVNAICAKKQQIVRAMRRINYNLMLYRLKHSEANLFLHYHEVLKARKARIYRRLLFFPKAPY